MSTVPDTGLTAAETPTVSQEDCLAQLFGVVREDYEAVAVDGVPVNEQARRRGVSQSTVSTNVKRGHERIASFIGDQPGITTTPRDSYDVDVKHVGSREPDGEPTTIGHWTFQTRMVREVVQDAIAGHKRVLNACAGKTVLDHPTGGEIIRNDINRDVDANHISTCARSKTRRSNRSRSTRFSSTLRSTRDKRTHTTKAGTPQSTIPPERISPHW